MSKRTQDFQKQEAKGSLWENDGHHIPKKHRNKGKGRGKDKRLTAELEREYDDYGNICGVDGFVCDRCAAVAFQEEEGLKSYYPQPDGD